MKEEGCACREGKGKNNRNSAAHPGSLRSASTRAEAESAREGERMPERKRARGKAGPPGTRDNGQDQSARVPAGGPRGPGRRQRRPKASRPGRLLAHARCCPAAVPASALAPPTCPHRERLGPGGHLRHVNMPAPPKRDRAMRARTRLVPASRPPGARLGQRARKPRVRGRAGAASLQASRQASRAASRTAPRIASTTTCGRRGVLEHVPLRSPRAALAILAWHSVWYL